MSKSNEKYETLKVYDRFVAFLYARVFHDSAKTIISLNGKWLENSHCDFREFMLGE